VITVTLGPEVGPMGEIWACYRGNRWLSWDQRLVQWDKYGLVIEGTGDYFGTRGRSHETNKYL
jgi:hypothetical protein